MEDFEGLKHYPLLDALRAQIETWAKANRKAVIAGDPVIPDHLDNRPKANWKPLLKVGHAHDKRWSGHAKQASIYMGSSHGGQDDSVMLLDHIAQIIGRDEYILTEDLVAALNENPDWPYGPDFNAHRLGRQLSPFKIRSEDKFWGGGSPATGKKRLRGYARKAFEGTWEIYEINYLWPPEGMD